MDIQNTYDETQAAANRAKCRKRGENTLALNAFRRQARKMKPTRQHRPALWENMLGTVYARNTAGETQYFDYDYKAAIAFVGEVEDVRVSRAQSGYSGDYQAPRRGQLVWFVKDVVR